MKIRTRIIVSNVAMLVVPLFIFMVISGFFRHKLDEDSRFFNFLRRTGGLDSAQTLVLSRTIAETPRFWTDTEALEALSKALDWQGDLALYHGDRPLWISSDADEEAVGNAVLSFTGGAERRYYRMFSNRGVVVAYAWDFAVPGEGIATFYFLTDYRRILSELQLPVVLFFSFVFFVLMLTNGFLAWMVSRSVLKPLKRLEHRAHRIRDGDLTPPPVNPSFGFFKGSDEFEQVFRSFDEMRLRLKVSLEQQEEMERNRQEMIASVSHDLRTPLAAIKGYAEGLKDGVAVSPEKTERYIDTILGKSLLMERLIDDLFLLSRLRTADFPYDKLLLDFRSWLEDFLDELKPDYPGLSIRTATRPPHPCPVLMDAFRMSRLVTNIVQNAQAYTEAGKGKLTVSMKAESGMAEVRFADNGPGIPPEDRDRVFDYHYRADPSRNREGGGLGLSIARLIATGHGGSIRAEAARPEEGGGACLVLLLPLEAS